MPVVYFIDVLDIPTQILQNNPNRVYAFIQNLGSYDIFLGFDNMVDYGQGIQLFANGGAVTLDYRLDGESVGYELFGKVKMDCLSFVYVYTVNVI